MGPRTAPGPTFIMSASVTLFWRMMLRKLSSVVRKMVAEKAGSLQGSTTPKRRDAVWLSDPCGTLGQHLPLRNKELVSGRNERAWDVCNDRCIVGSAWRDHKQGMCSGTVGAGPPCASNPASQLLLLAREQPKRISHEREPPSLLLHPAGCVPATHSSIGFKP